MDALAPLTTPPLLSLCPQRQRTLSAARTCRHRSNPEMGALSEVQLFLQVDFGAIVPLLFRRCFTASAALTRTMVVTARVTREVHAGHASSFADSIAGRLGPQVRTSHDDCPLVNRFNRAVNTGTLMTLTSSRRSFQFSLHFFLFTVAPPAAAWRAVKETMSL